MSPSSRSFLILLALAGSLQSVAGQVAEFAKNYLIPRGSEWRFYYDSGAAVIELSRPVRFDTVDPGDLRIGGIAATGVVADSQRQLRFTPPSGFDVLMNDVVLAAGSRTSLSGMSVARFDRKPYPRWAEQFFGVSASDPAVAAPTADFNGDGLANLVCYALGLDPRVAPSQPLLNYTAYSSTRGLIRFSTLPSRGVGVTLTRSTNMKTWEEVPVDLDTWERRQDGATVFRATVSNPGIHRYFYRLDIAQ